MVVSYHEKSTTTSHYFCRGVTQHYICKYSVDGVVRVLPSVSLIVSISESNPHWKAPYEQFFFRGSRRHCPVEVGAYMLTID